MVIDRSDTTTQSGKTEVREEDARRLLETRARQQAAVAALGQRALAGVDLPTLMDEVVTLITETLEIEYSKVLELLPGRGELRLRAGVGWRDGLVGQATVPAGLDSQAGYTLLSNEPVIVEDLRTEERFSGPPLLHEHGVVSGMSVIIQGRGRPFGVLGAHTTTRRRFTRDDVNFLVAIANILGAAIDRNWTEDALAESEERFRTLFEMAPDVVFSISTDGRITALSPAFERLTGWTRAEWLDRSFAGIIHPEDLPTSLGYFQQVLTGRATPPHELRVLTKDGQYIHGEFRSVPKIESGQVVEVFGIARDVTDRHRVEEELRRSRDELAIILHGVTDGITVQNTSGELIYANQAAARSIGFASPEELLAAPVSEVLERFEVMDEAGNPFPLDRLPGRLALQGLSSPPVTLRFRMKATGEERWSVVSANPVLDRHRQVQFAINIFHDVTERKRIEVAQDFLAEASTLLASSLDYETTLQHVGRLAVPFLADWCIFDIVQPDGSLRRIAAHSNPEKEKLVRELAERFPLNPDSPHVVARVLRSGRAELMPVVPSPLPSADHLEPERVRIIEELGFRSSVVVPLIARGRTIGVISLVMAGSGRRYGANDLELAQELARRAAIAVDNALLYREARNAVARVEALAEASRAFAEVTLDLQALLDTIVRVVGDLIGDQCILRLITEDGKQLGAAAIYHPDPDTRTFLTEYLGARPQGVHEGIVGQVVRTGEPLLIPVVDQRELRRSAAQHHLQSIDRVPIHSILIVPLRVRDRVIGTLGIGRDRPGKPYVDDDRVFLTEIADRAALALENARLYREAQEAIKAREQFLSIASHELKTPLTSIKASAQLLDRRLGREPVDLGRARQFVNQLQGEIIRLEYLVADLLDATRIQQGRLDLRWEQVDLVQLAEQVIGRFELAPQRLPDHALVLDADGPVEAIVDPARLDQVVTNLVSNALKYSPNGGEVRIAVRASDSEAEISVSDQGIGIRPEEQQRLFQPFARGDAARQSVGGTGLGLFISAQIVERHHGTISVDSRSGAGSTFTVRVPRQPVGTGDGGRGTRDE